MARRRTRTSVVVDFARLLELDPQLAGHHQRCTDLGMTLGAPRLWQRRDGSFSARFVWRRREGLVHTSIVYSCHYVPAPAP
ncbi:hypothetical protein [Xanthobacter sp. KR7-225]|uniref:hypothetical protein n=1 Tax=Xanthobacter sp. KR7-225 TaxID=3156613 RepID=UPI0032B54674